MSDMEADDFADTYAQTLTYSLFLARLEAGPIRELDAAWKAIPDDIPILKSAIEPLRVQGDFPEPMAVWLTDQLHLLASTPDSVIASIGHPIGGSPDPILYFYEHFLTAYDKVERVRKGVYYTPRPLVDYLVRAVHESLKRDFGRPLGLADKDVRLLDPAVGTGTFPLAAAQVAVDEIATTLGPGAIRTVLEDHVLQHFFGFELLPAPYTRPWRPRSNSPSQTPGSVWTRHPRPGRLVSTIMLSVKVSTKHQIVVPSQARRELGIQAGDRLEVFVTDDAIVLRKRPARASDRLRGLAAGKGWYEPDPVTYVRRLRDETEARAREREELVAHLRSGHSPADSAGQQRSDLPPGDDRAGS